jgi:membrane protease subunit (stomatin/prohibitin family)
MAEDRFTNTPKDAAAFERSRAIDAGEDDRPSRAELAEDEWTCARCGKKMPPTKVLCANCVTEPDPDFTCAHCGRELMPSEGWLCTDCAEHDR